MSGYLSQAVANLTAAENQISAVSGLPAAARTIQQESAAATSPAIAHIQSTQKAVAAFVQQANSELDNIEAMVTDNSPLTAIKSAIANVQSEGSGLQSTVNKATTQIKTISAQVLGYFNQLATIESDLTAQMTSLQGQLGEARSEEEATKKKYYYLLALGPFGLAGLAAALGLYLKWKGDVNKYQDQINALHKKIDSFRAMKSACQQLGSYFQDLVSKISGVKNSVDFLVSDILEIESDLDSGDTLSIINIKIKAGITEVMTLGIDAS